MHINKGSSERRGGYRGCVAYLTFLLVWGASSPAIADTAPPTKRGADTRLTATITSGVGSTTIGRQYSVILWWCPNPPDGSTYVYNAVIPGDAPGVPISWPRDPNETQTLLNGMTLPYWKTEGQMCWNRVQVFQYTGRASYSGFYEANLTQAADPVECHITVPANQHIGTYAAGSVGETGRLIEASITCSAESTVETFIYGRDGKSSIQFADGLQGKLYAGDNPGEKGFIQNVQEGVRTGIPLSVVLEETGNASAGEHMVSVILMLYYE